MSWWPPPVQEEGPVSWRPQPVHGHLAVGSHLRVCPQYGLYSAFTGCFVYFFLGTSRDVTLGPTAIMSLLVSLYTFREPAYAVLLAFLSGCIQLAMGLLCLGETAPSLARHLPGEHTFLAAWGHPGGMLGFGKGPARLSLEARTCGRAARVWLSCSPAPSPCWSWVELGEAQHPLLTTQGSCWTSSPTRSSRGLRLRLQSPSLLGRSR